MPFLPFVLLIAWQALSRSASFLLGWATSLFFGQVPGNKGRVVSITALLSVAWVAVLVGMALPLGVGWVAERLGVVEHGFQLPAIAVWAMLLGLVVTPPALAALAMLETVEGERSVGRWLQRVPASYPATGSLGLAVLQMVLVSPALAFDRVRRRRRLLQVPVVLHSSESTDDLHRPVAEALRSLQVGEFERRPLRWYMEWPLRTAGFAARHLLGHVVRGTPLVLGADDLEVIVYATNVGILGREEDAYRARAAIERELAFSRAFLTWSAESQGFEDALRRLWEARDGDGRLRRQLDDLQQRIDAASLTSDEWNILFRLRLQLESSAADEAKRPDRELVSARR